MRIADILGDKGVEVHKALPWITVAEAAKRLTDADVGALVVCDGEHRIRGIVSERDIVRGLTRRGAAVLAEPVESVMTRDVHTCDSQEAADHSGASKGCWTKCGSTKPYLALSRLRFFPVLIRCLGLPRFHRTREVRDSG